MNGRKCNHDEKQVLLIYFLFLYINVYIEKYQNDAMISSKTILVSDKNNYYKPQRAQNDSKIKDLWSATILKYLNFFVKRIIIHDKFKIFLLSSNYP